MLLRHGDLATLSPVLSPSTPRPRSRLPRVHLLLADSLERHVPILPRHCNLTRSLGRAPPLLPRHSELATFHPIESSRIPSFLSLLPSTDRLYKPCLPSDFDGSEKGGSCFCPWNPSLSRRHRSGGWYLRANGSSCSSGGGARTYSSEVSCGGYQRGGEPV